MTVKEIKYITTALLMEKRAIYLKALSRGNFVKLFG